MTVDFRQRAVPFVDLSTTHAPLKQGILDDISELVDSGAFTNGPHVAAFEEAFAGYHDARHCIGVGSGLDALRLILIAAGLERGDEVIVPAMTFVASFEAVTQAGGVPVPVEIDPTTYTLDPDAVAAAVTARTRAIMPVHLYGQMADMTALGEIARRHGLLVVEDACQSHGAQRDGTLAGTAGTASAFSFYPTKNLGAMGDAGAVVTDDDGLADSIRALREHGQRSKYAHDVEGFTSRLDTLQAAVLLRKLPGLDAANAQRAEAASRYDELLPRCDDLVLPAVAADSRPVWHLYVIRTGRPTELGDHLRGRGIATGRHYPVPPHLTDAYASLGFVRGAFPVAEALADECLSLPLFPGMTADQVAAAADGVDAFFNG
jgi:dTDP-3-amino-3,4,6-trideoxy-alpha-D-glucose transaminase